MSYIYSGSSSVEDVENFLGGKKITVAYAKDQDNPNANYYEFWADIKHPETGEKLRATKGYCNPDNMYQCYYAEYQGEDGRYYHYIDSRYYHDAQWRGTKSINQQQYEDKQELRVKEASQRHSDFFSQEGSKENIGRSSHKDFFETSDFRKSSEEDNSHIVAKDEKNSGHSQLQGK